MLAARGELALTVREDRIRFVLVYQSLKQAQRNAGHNRATIATPDLGIVEIARGHDVAVTFLTFDTWNKPGSTINAVRQ